MARVAKGQSDVTAVGSTHQLSPWNFATRTSIPMQIPVTHAGYRPRDLNRRPHQRCAWAQLRHAAANDANKSPGSGCRNFHVIAIGSSDS